MSNKPKDSEVSGEENRDYEKAALAWMKAQAKALSPDVQDDWGPLYLARVISAHIDPAPKHYPVWVNCNVHPKESKRYFVRHKVTEFMNVIFFDGVDWDTSYPESDLEYLDDHPTHSIPIREAVEEPKEDHGMCKEKGCNRKAVRDYNGHGHWVCQLHYDCLSKYFDEEYK